MNELNKDTLHQALRRLPEYEPPVMVWEQLDTTLSIDAQLTYAAQQLPLHTPPEVIWDQIAAHLPDQQLPAGRVSLWLRLALGFVFVAVLFVAWWLLRPATDTNMAAAVVVTQEILDPQIVATVREREDDAYSWVNNLCAARAPVCNQPEFLSLKSELDDLTAAKQQVYAALGQYGDDPDMAAQLVQIELARTQVLQEIMQMI
jgi:hypothetical protein